MARVGLSGVGMMSGLTAHLGPIELRTPLVGASGTVGSVVEFAGVGALEAYGALVAKSVSPEPWEGRPPPRLAPLEIGMLNGIGIQNPGIEAWRDRYADRIAKLDVDVWGSAVAHDVAGFGRVAAGLAAAGVAAVEVNLSCPNLDGDTMFAFDPEASAAAVAAVREAVELPIGAKLSPDADDLVAVAEACVAAGADWLTLTNTARGTGFDPATGEPLLSGVVGGLSGPPLRPIALRCVVDVRGALPHVPIVGCGGVVTGLDALDHLRAGAQAVAIGTVHLAEPRAGRRILAELEALLEGAPSTAAYDGTER